MHVVICHSVNLMKTHKSIGMFSQEGFEAAHRVHRMIYYRSTNRDAAVGINRVQTDSLEQVLNKVYRLLYLGNEIILNRKKCICPNINI